MKSIVLETFLGLAFLTNANALAQADIRSQALDKVMQSENVNLPKLPQPSSDKLKQQEIKSILTEKISTLSRGGVATGGGDVACEGRIKIIREDLAMWIKKGGASGLSLPPNISVSQYSDAMLSQIKKAKIKCVGPGDEGYPVNINKTAKACKFEATQHKSQIICDYSKFESTSDSDQYVLVHHEFAGLANIEVPRGDDSHYSISNQISGYLVDQVVKKLAISPPLACINLDHDFKVCVGNTVYKGDAYPVGAKVVGVNKKQLRVTVRNIYDKETYRESAIDLDIRSGCTQGICFGDIVYKGDSYPKGALVLGVNNLKKTVTVRDLSYEDSFVNERENAENLDGINEP